MQTAQTARIEGSQPPNFESVWASIQELKERQQENARQQEKTDRQIKEFNIRFGALTNFFGEIAEYMIAPNLREKFIELGHKFPQATQNVSVNDKDNKIFLEIDVMLENGDKAMLVEIKNKLTNERINNHIERLEKMRRYANLRNDKRKFLGAVAGVVVTEEVKNYALNQGLFLIEPSGDNFNITPPNGEPKEW